MNEFIWRKILLLFVKHYTRSRETAEEFLEGELDDGENRNYIAFELIS